MRKSFKAVFVVLLVLALASTASALSPQDALSARPAKSVYTVARIDDLSRALQDIFSPANIEMLASLADPEEAQYIRLMASFASQIPAKSVALASGITADKKPFLQIAASMPASVRSKLSRVADGSASGVEIITLLLGDGGMMLAAAVQPEVQKGAKGPYYDLEGVAFAAKDDLLLMASSPAELEASINALEKKGSRLNFKRRFDSPNYWYMHMDMPTLSAFAVETGEFGKGKPEQFAKSFKAPLQLEIAFSSKPGSFLVSCAANILESMTDTARYKNMKPAKGANLFLAGGGKLLFALSSSLAFKPADLKAYPEISSAWGKLVKELEKIKISERDVEDLLNGSFSVAFGSEATILGKRAPGGYLALTGRKGAAAKILGKLMDSEQFTQAAPLAPLKADGWDSLYTLDPALLPLPLLVGVMKDSLFMGVVDSSALGKTPQLPATASGILKDPLFGVGIIDTAAIWDLMRRETADPDSLLSTPLQDSGAVSLLKDVLEAELTVPLIKTWSPKLETVFLEFSIVDVPDGKRLFPRLIKAAEKLNQQDGGKNK